MTLLTGFTSAINILLGVVYISYAFMTMIDLRRHRAHRGGSHLAYAFIAIMLTCGPHHVDHGLHLATGGGPAGSLDLLVVLTGIPTGLTWFLLRVEAVRGGPGDRQISNQLVVDVVRTVMGAAFVLVVAAVLAFEVPAPGWGPQVVTWRLLPNIMLVGLYLGLGTVLLRTQLRRHAVNGTWSLSGIGLTGVFPTCAAMHVVWVGYVATGFYEPETHLLIIDTVAVPATAYFLIVTWLLGEGWLPDWTEAAGDVARPHGADDAEVAELLDSRA